MKVLSIIIFLVSISISSIAQEEFSEKFPDSYFGIYKGTLYVSSEKGSQTYPMEFHLLPTDKPGHYDYKLIYGEGDSRQVRPYTLIAKDASAGTYVVDENNGIVLDDKVVGNRMYALFEVQDTLLTTFITFESDHMIFEIVATNTSKKNTTGGTNEDTPEVISYPISVVQRAKLLKQ